MDVPATVAQTLMVDAASLRRLAEGLLGRDEAEDVVQEASAAALAQPASSLRHPGLWLRGTVRRLALMARRGNARRLARERLVAKSEADPRDPAAMAMQAELVRDIGTALHELEEPFRTAILLRYWHDLTPNVIAVRLGVSRNTVRSRLQRGLARLRERLDQEHGNRAGWAAPLGAFLPLHVPLATTALCLMNKKLLLGASAVLLAALAIPWLLREPAPAVDPVAKDPTPAVASMPLAEEAGEPAVKREPVALQQPEVVTTGTLVVRVLYADEPKAGSGLTITVGIPDGDFRVGLLRADTDAAGMARFENVAPGQVKVRCTAGGSTRVEVRAGETTECLLQFSGGVTVTGIVVDAAGVGIAGALVETGFSASSGADADVAAITAADGTFVVRDAYPWTLVGARAKGYAASQLYSLARGQETAKTVRIELGALGGCVGGSVVTEDGKPVRDAVVRVGEGQLDSLRSTPQGAPPLPAQVRTDAEGRFLAVGVPVGTCPVQVRAAWLVPWTGTCDVTAGLVANVNVRLLAGVTCTGVVRTEAGEPVADVSVRGGRDGEFLQYFAKSAADGTFTLKGLPAAEIEVWAAAKPHGKASARVRGQAGATVPCELVLSNGLALRGHVTDENGKPVQWVQVTCEATGAPRWWKHELTDASGQFAVPDCPAGRLLLVKASARNRVPCQRQDVDPRAGELRLQLPRDTSVRARITGRIVGPDGQRATGVEVRAFGPPQSDQHESLELKSDDGSFTIEAMAGTWEVRVQSNDHPTVFAGKRDLQAGSIWDLGLIQLSNGGTLVVHDDGRKDIDYWVLDAREQFRCSLYNPGTPRRSELLAPGDHLLVVQAKGIATQVLPFTIRSGQETELVLHPKAGVRQRFEFVPAPGTELPAWISCYVRRDGKLVAFCSEDGEKAVRTGEIWLEPGDYVLTSSVEGRQATAAIKIGSEEGPPLRVTIH